MKGARAAILLDAERRRAPDVVRLAAALSLAVRIEPALLRRARRALFPRRGPDLEADLWLSSLVESRSPLEIVLRTDVVQLLRPELRAEPELLERAWRILRGAHEAAPATLRIEEHLSYLGLRSDAEAASEVEELLRRVIASLVQRTEKAGLVQWIVRALPALPESVRGSEAARMLAAGAELHGAQRAIDGVQVSASAASRWRPWLTGGKPEPMAIGARWVRRPTPDGPRSELLLRVPPEQGDARIDVPKEPRLALELHWPDPGPSPRPASNERPSSGPLWEERHVVVEDGAEQRVPARLGPLRVTTAGGERVWLRPGHGARPVLRVSAGAPGETNAPAEEDPVSEARSALLAAAEELGWATLADPFPGAEVPTPADARLWIVARGERPPDELGVWRAPDAGPPSLLLVHGDSAGESGIDLTARPTYVAGRDPTDPFERDAIVDWLRTSLVEIELEAGRELVRRRVALLGTRGSFAGDVDALLASPPEGIAFDADALDRSDPAQRLSDGALPAIGRAASVVVLAPAPGLAAAFELGHALGRGRDARLVVPAGAERERPWNRALFGGATVGLAGNDPRRFLARLVELPGTLHWLDRAPGDATLVLGAAEEVGAALRGSLSGAPGEWRIPEHAASEWRELDAAIEGAGRVAWILPGSLPVGDDLYLDAFAAGYALASGLELTVLRPVEVGFGGESEAFGPWAQPTQGPQDLLERLQRFAAGARLSRAEAATLERYRALLRDEGPPLGAGKALALEEAVELGVQRERPELADVLGASVTPPRRVPLAAALGLVGGSDAADEPAREDLGEARPHGRHVLLVAFPGGGTTASLVTLARSQAAEPAGALAVYLDASGFRADEDSTGLLEREIDRAGGRVEGLGKAFLAARASGRRCVLLLDGLEQVAGRDRLAAASYARAWENSFPDVDLVVAAGDEDSFSFGEGWERLHVSLLGVPQRHELVERRLGKEIAERVEDALVRYPRLRVLATGPQGALWIAEWAARETALPERELQALDGVLDRALEGALFGPDAVLPEPGAARSWLAELALALFEQKRLPWGDSEARNAAETVRRTLPHGAPSWPAAEEMLARVARGARLFAVWGDPRRWSFLDVTLGALLASQALRPQPERLARWAAELRPEADAVPVVELLLEALDDAGVRLLDELRRANPALALAVLPRLERLAPERAFELLRAGPGWDGAHLLALLEAWQQRGFDAEQVRRLLWSEITPKLSLEEQAFYLYALERSLLGVDLDEFFRATGHEPPPGRDAFQVVGVPPDPRAESAARSGVRPTKGDEAPRKLPQPLEVTRTAISRGEWGRFALRAVADLELAATNLSWWEAWLFARWAGGALPSEEEWLFAAAADAERSFATKPLRKMAPPGIDMSARALSSLPENAWGLRGVDMGIREWLGEGLVDPRSPGARFAPAAPRRLRDTLNGGGGERPAGERAKDLGFRVVFAPRSGEAASQPEA